jgi:hypothetical protein
VALVQHDADLWSAEYEIGGPAGLIPIPVRTTVIRIGGGSLVLHSPGPISDELRDELADQPPAAWSGQIESHLLLGFRLHEVVLFHRPSRSLVITDLCFNIHRSESRIARSLFRANGMWRRFGPSRLIRLLVVSDRPALDRSLERILRWDFDRIVPGHGDVLDHGGPAALRAAWRLA